jgi:UDP-2-acetamido-3-amino-2,3-dideoxy-glucuronate N-acetyltransferase
MTLVPSDRAPGLHVAPGTTVPDDARIAPHVTIYDGVQLGAGVMLEQGAVLGRPQQLDERSRSPRRFGVEATIIGDGCRVGSSTVVVAGARVGRGTYLSDLVLIRETAVLGEEVMIGRVAVVNHNARVGDRTRIQTLVIVGPWTDIEEDVHVGPRVTFIGDPTMGRRPAEAVPRGIVVRRASRIGTSAIVFQDVEVGEEAVIGAAAMVRSDVPPRTVVVGTPARPLRAVGEDELLEVWREDSR